MFHSPITWSQSFSEPLPLGCDLHKCISAFLSDFDVTGRLEQAGAEHYYFPHLLGYGKTHLGFCKI